MMRFTRPRSTSCAMRVTFVGQTAAMTARALPRGVPIVPICTCIPALSAAKTSRSRAASVSRAGAVSGSAAEEQSELQSSSDDGDGDSADMRLREAAAGRDRLRRSGQSTR